jgi:alpha-L-fucosidase
LLNVGPRGEDAQIPDEQLARLGWLAEWMATNGHALQDTRPWVRPADTSADGTEVRYTARGRNVWAFRWRGDELPTVELIEGPTAPAPGPSG